MLLIEFLIIDYFQPANILKALTFMQHFLNYLNKLHF